jgi:threonine dehydratase
MQDFCCPGSNGSHCTNSEMRPRKIVHRGFTLHNVIPTLESVQRARSFLKSYLPQTRLVAAPSLGRSVHLKLETDLPTGSFKPRGALFALSENLARGQVKEVIASSTGNHGAAVAYAAKLLNVPARIFLPSDPNPVKRKRITDLGAEIVEVGAPDLVGSTLQALQHAKRPGVCFLNDATDNDVPCGTGTIALEILEQLAQAQAIYVPMGDTALIRGIAATAKHLAPKIKIIGVQAERAPAYYLSWKKGRPITTDNCDTIADGLATRTPETDNVTAIRELLDDIKLVSEEQMLAAIRHLLFEEHLLAEPSGAATTAAWMNSRNDAETVLLVTGANIAPEILRRAACGV